MKSKIFIAFLIITSAGMACASEPVSFKSSLVESANHAHYLTGRMAVPPGDGPFPAVIFMHGCGGLSRNMRSWAKRLYEWGYAVLVVDSFGPRGTRQICDSTAQLLSYYPVRVQDAYDARKYLSGLPHVDPGRIAIMGWSHGGGVVLRALSKSNNEPFRAAVAFYPWCDFVLDGLNAPLLILIGEKDDWTPAARCSQAMVSDAEPEVILKIYPGAYHCFDYDAMDTWVRGAVGMQRLLSDPEATADAARTIRDFLKRHMP